MFSMISVPVLSFRAALGRAQKGCTGFNECSAGVSLKLLVVFEQEAHIFILHGPTNYEVCPASRTRVSGTPVLLCASFPS